LCGLSAIVGLSREEWLAVRLAELLRESEATAENWKAERTAAARNLAVSKAEVGVVRGELAKAEAALERKVKPFGMYRNRFWQAQKELVNRKIELASRRSGTRTYDSV
jgi:hypothetical protein